MKIISKIKKKFEKLVYDIYKTEQSKYHILSDNVIILKYNPRENINIPYRNRELFMIDPDNKFNFHLFTCSLDSQNECDKIFSIQEKLHSSLNINTKPEYISLKRVDPYPSEFFLNKRYAACLHALSWYTYAGIKAELLNIDEVYGDLGIIHELAHYLTIPEGIQGGKPKEDIYKDILELEQHLFGLLPKYETDYNGMPVKTTTKN